MALLVVIAGLLGLTVLRPEFDAAVGEPLHEGRAFSVPFVVTNKSIYGVTEAHFGCFFHEVEFPGFSFRDSFFGDGFSGPLGHNDTRTFRCSVDVPQPKKADIVVVADFKVPLLPIHFRRYFRYTGAAGDKWQWWRQPSADVEDLIDKFLGKPRDKW